MSEAKIPYYVVKKGRGYFQPNAALRARGFYSVPCGEDGARARQLAARIAASVERQEPKHLQEEVGRLLRKSLNNARSRAKKRGIECTLTLDGVIEMAKANNWCCALSGIPFSMLQMEGGIVRQPYGPSIDRIDNRRGYVSGNVRIVLIAVNYAMNEWGENVFRKVALGIAKSINGEQKLELVPSSTNLVEILEQS